MQNVLVHILWIDAVGVCASLEVDVVFRLGLSPNCMDLCRSVRRLQVLQAVSGRVTGLVAYSSTEVSGSLSSCQGIPMSWLFKLEGMDFPAPLCRDSWKLPVTSKVRRSPAPLSRHGVGIFRLKSRSQYVFTLCCHELLCKHCCSYARARIGTVS